PSTGTSDAIPALGPRFGPATPACVVQHGGFLFEEPNSIEVVSRDPGCHECPARASTRPAPEGGTRRLTEESLPCHTTSRTETPNIEGSSTFRLNGGTVCRARTSFRSVSFLGCSMTTLTVQSALLALTDYWAEHGCVITQPSNVEDRKSTRLNSSHVSISYAVFCLKKKRARCDHHEGMRM